MSSSCVDDPMTSEAGLILASVTMTPDGCAVNDVSDRGLQNTSSEPKQENISVVKFPWSVSVASTPPMEIPPPEVAPGNAAAAASDQQSTAHASKPLNMTTTTTSGADRGHPERKRRPSNDSHDSSTKMSESAVDDNRDDDDDNDDDDDETKLSSPDIDPERLKAFNLFVRLFIDENLDRSVPISKQPKDKIQAILEACDRQFAEFHDRARKRIRTYLKSCRRLRRSKEGSTIDQIRPTPPHLTSAIAESILAQACENESNNAKRMRMGLEPLPAVSAPGPTTAGLHPVSQKSSSPPSTAAGVAGLPSQAPPPPYRALFPFPKLERASPVVLPQGLSLAPPPPPPTETEKPRGGIVPSGPTHPNCYDAQALCYPTSAGATGPRSAYPTAGYQRPAHYHHHHHQNTTTTTTPLTNNNSNNSNNNNNNGQLQNGPTDLSLKSSNNSMSTSSGKNQLNSSEMATIRQLIAGYRESAAFLFRSADELEQLLIHHK